jgi:hypothetical protein
MLSSCGESKRIFTGNYAFKYVDNQFRRLKNPKLNDKFYIYKFKRPVKSRIDEKPEYLVIKKPDSLLKSSVLIDSISVTKPKPEKIQMNGVIYSTETSVKSLEDYQKSFFYSNWNFALQPLTIPLKFRKALDDGTMYPNQVECGINIGFAPVMKYNINVFNPSIKILGKSLNQYSVNTGLIFNIGATDLSTTTTAPGLKSNRKAPMFTYGTFIMIGINNINIGYAIGKDKVIGEGHSYWVYQNKIWSGIIIALNIINQ